MTSGQLTGEQVTRRIMDHMSNFRSINSTVLCVLVTRERGIEEPTGAINSADYARVH